MKKFREFWVDPNFGGTGAVLKESDDPHDIDGIIHVVEKAALDEVADKYLQLSVKLAERTDAMIEAREKLDEALKLIGELEETIQQSLYGYILLYDYEDEIKDLEGPSIDYVFKNLTPSEIRQAIDKIKTFKESVGE